jgi:hypothetical protein
MLQEKDIDITRLDKNGWRALDLTHEDLNPHMRQALESNGQQKERRKASYSPVP